MHWSLYLFGGLSLLYSVRMLSYLIAWKKSQRENGLPSRSISLVSVVIPFRNEDRFLPCLLDDLAEQDFPSEHYEVILVDDHSTDQSVIKTEEITKMHSNFHLYTLEGPGYGKKHALQLGIQMAGGSMILTSDGDCRVGTGWIREMVREFSMPGVRMVLGAVLFEPVNGLFQMMQLLEFSSLIGTAAGAAGVGRPILCNAANMAFYREDYLQFLKDTDRQVTSGDDIFLMLWIKKRWHGSIRFAASRQTIVRTRPADSALGFFNQRIRWASKSRFYRDKDIIMTALLVYLVNACLLASCIAGFFRPSTFLLFISLLAVKSLTDFLFLSAVLKYYRLRKLLWLLIPLEIIYFVYVSVTGLLGQILPYTWKGRRVRK